ncbi:hypothetical protein VP01_23g1 [Puccinia sorghi]|uniref:F-box domain-containing protein n=1 Tax=Puccinia sorghi TaxID=27349 RepID=A0A0L6V6S1_9BASI|nr:hypothetical protein VP01_23g1 [Puccinia sorghi]
MNIIFECHFPEEEDYKHLFRITAADPTDRAWPGFQEKASQVEQAERLLIFEHAAADPTNPTNNRSAAALRLLRFPSRRKTDMLKRAASLDSSNPTSRLKRQLSQCSKVVRPLDISTSTQSTNTDPMAATESYEEARMHLQSLKLVAHSPKNFHPRAFTSKRPTASLPYVTHLIPREILTESLPQKPAGNFLFKALPMPPVDEVEAERTASQSTKWKTDLGRSSSAPTRVRFANPMVQYSSSHTNTPKSASELSSKLSQRPATTNGEPPRSCIKSSTTVEHHKEAGKNRVISEILHSDPVRLYCDSPLPEEDQLQDTIKLMADWIFPEELDGGRNKQLQQGDRGGGVTVDHGHARCWNSRNSRELMPSSNNVGKDIRSGSTSHKLELNDEPRCLQQSRTGHFPAPNYPLPLPEESFPSPSLSLSAAAPFTSLMPISLQHPSREKLACTVPFQRQEKQEHSSPVPKDRRDTSIKFAMSSKTRRIAVSSNFNNGGRARKLPVQGMRIPTGGKITAGGSGEQDSEHRSATTDPRQISSNDSGKLAGLSSPAIDEEEDQCHQNTGPLSLFDSDNNRCFRERTDQKSTPSSPHSSEPLTLPPSKDASSSQLCPLSPTTRNLPISPSSCPDYQALTLVSPVAPCHPNSRLGSPHSVASLLPVPEGGSSSSQPDSRSDVSQSSDTSRDFSPEELLLSPDSLDLSARSSSAHSSSLPSSPITHRPTITTTTTTSPLSWNCLPVHAFDHAENSVDQHSEPSSPSIVIASETKKPDGLDMFGRELEGQAAGVEKDGKIKIRRRRDTIAVGEERRRVPITAVCSGARRSCTSSSNRWAKWDSYLSEQQEEVVESVMMGSSSESSGTSTTGRSSFSESHATEDSLLWDSAPQIAIIKPDQSLFSELSFSPLHPTDPATGLDDLLLADTHCLFHSASLGNQATSGPSNHSPGAVSNSLAQDQAPFSNQEYAARPNLSARPDVTAKISKPPMISRKRCLPFIVPKRYDPPDTWARRRRRRSHRTGSTNRRTTLPSGENAWAPSLHDHPGEEENKMRMITKFESSLLRFAPTILRRILEELEYHDFLSLSQVSRVLRAGFALGEAKETILQVFLGHLGYCRCLTNVKATKNNRSLHGTTIEMDGFETSTSNVPLLLKDGRSEWAREAMMDTKFSWSLMTRLRKIHTSNPLEITLQELHSFQRFWETGGEERLLIRARFLAENPHTFPAQHSLHCRFENTPFSNPNPALFRLWIPAASPRMSKADVLKCEVELLRQVIRARKKRKRKTYFFFTYRSGIHAFVRRGDIIWNLALDKSEMGSKLIYDGLHLQELSDLEDPAGHIPVSNQQKRFPCP